MLLKSKKFVNASLWQSANKRCLPFPPHTNSLRSGRVVRELGEVQAVLLEISFWTSEEMGNQQ
jgi:hypothetical protein